MISESRLRSRYIITDLITCNLAWFMFNLVRYFTLPSNYSYMSLDTYFNMPVVRTGQILFPILLIILFAISGFYNQVYIKSRINELINSFGVSLIGSVLIFFIALFNDDISDRMQNYEMVLLLWMLFSFLTLLPRLIITTIVIKDIQKRKIFFPTLIIGVNEKARELTHTLENRYPKMGLKVIGYVDTKHENTCIESFNSLPVIPFSKFNSYIEDNDVHTIVVVNTPDNITDTLSIINRILPSGKTICVTPDTMHLIASRPKTQVISGEVLIDVSNSSIPASTYNIKRIADISISSLALLLLSPLLATIAFFVKKSSPGPVFYKQERVGKNNKTFDIYKFRTMYVDSESQGPQLSSQNDPRITNVGHFLRKYRLDELPQFFNVIKGDMSIVGPRPERRYYLDKIIERAPYVSMLQKVRPGITSWGMVKYGYAENIDQMIERAKFDMLYIDNVSMIVDLKILLYTIETVITGKGV